jgi:hypothetical protein
MLRNGGKTHGVHFEDGGRRNQVADGPEEDGKLPEIIDRGSVKKNEVWFSEHS